MNIGRSNGLRPRPGAEGTIVAEGLTKVFHTTARRPGPLSAVTSLIRPQRIAKAAVSDVSFRIDPGQLVAFLGPNGAGKSTTVIPNPYTYWYEH